MLYFLKYIYIWWFQREMFLCISIQKEIVKIVSRCFHNFLLSFPKWSSVQTITKPICLWIEIGVDHQNFVFCFILFLLFSSLFFIQLQMWKLNERKCLGNLLFRYFGNLNFRQVFKGWKRPLNLLDFSFKKSQHKIATEWKVWFSLVVWCYWKLSQNSFYFLIKTDHLTNNY